MSLRNCSRFGLLALLLSVAALADDAPQTPQQARINSVGEGPYFRLNLPLGIYPTAAHADLRELRIRNASGNLVPYAWLNNETTELQILSATVAFYPVELQRGDAASTNPASPDMSIEFTQKPDGTLTLKTQRRSAEKKAPEETDWIIDASPIKGSLLQARFGLADNAEGLFPLSIEGSDDLRDWHIINTEAQLAALKRPDGKIEKFTVDLFASRAKYLRLHWRDTSHAPDLKSVQLDSVQQNETITPLQWSAPIQATTCSESFCDYPLPANTPLDSLRINLAETNTLASITVLAQSPAFVAHDYPRRHHPLYILRHKRQSSVTSPAPTTDVILTQSVTYRLKQSNGEVRSEDMALDGGIYKRLRIQTQGPISLLGQTAPTVEIASTARSLLFLGRGSPPFSLHWGVDDQQGGALPLTTLVPGYQANKPLLADTATVDIAAPAQTLSQTPPAAKAKSIAKETPAPGNKLWLWAALTAGLLILAGMAWSLFRSMAKPEQNEPK